MKNKFAVLSFFFSLRHTKYEQKISLLGYSVSEMQLRVRKSLDYLKNVEKSPSLADNAVLQRDPVPGCHRAAPLARWWQAAVIRNHQLC